MFQMLADELVVQTETERVVRWGQIIDVSPTLVRFAGDTSDTQIDLSLTSYTPAVTDKVLLVRVGASWVILGAIG